MIKKQRGVTLIELMVSMMLGLALVAGISQLFIQSQKSFTMQRNLSDMTDDGTFVLEDLAKGLLVAGYSESGANFSCSKTIVTKTPISGLPTSTTTKTCSDKNDSPRTPLTEITETQPNVLSSGLDLNCPTVTTNATNATNAIESTKTEISTTTCEIIKGADNALVYRFVLDSTKSQKNNSICIVDSYSAYDVVPVYITYKSSDHSMSCTSKSTSQPMISEVEKLVFKYGIHDKTANTFYYAKAADVSDWTKVFAVKVFLVMRSADKNLTRFKTGWSIEGGTTEYPAIDEKRLYKVFSKTIYLRAADH